MSPPRIPFALAIAAAWSCYGGKPARVENVLKLVHGPAPANLSPQAEADRADRRERALRLYADLFAAGHHTTFQHASFTFVLDNVSRLAIWSFFHAHPYYNSEQVSQRYREVSGAVMTTPDLPATQLAIYQSGDRDEPRGVSAADRDPLGRRPPRLHAPSFRRGRRRPGRRPRRRWPPRSRSGRRRWRGTSCRWRRRPTSTTRSMR